MKLHDKTGSCKQNHAICEIHKNEVVLLKDFLYEAIFIPEGVTPPPRSILDQPELRVYIDDFGSRKGDYCLVADYDGKVVGAVWTRIMNDYGHVDDDTPSFATSLYKEYRGKGYGAMFTKRRDKRSYHGEIFDDTEMGRKTGSEIYADHKKREKPKQLQKT